MIVRSPLGRRRPRSRKVLWQQARFRLPVSQLADLTAFHTADEAVPAYPYTDPNDPDESQGGPLRSPPLGSRNTPGMGQGDDVVDALLGEVDDLLEKYGEDDDDVAPTSSTSPLERRATNARRAATANLDPRAAGARGAFWEGLAEGLRTQEVLDAERRFDEARRSEARVVRRLDKAEEAEAFGSSENEIRAARRAKKVARSAAKEASQVRKKAAEALRAAKLAAKVKKVEKKAAKVGVVPKPTKVGAAPAMQPIFDPAHNLREASKQMILLEDHLFHPPRRCHDCIRKHMLTAEGLAEEAATLDKEGEWKAWTAVLPKQYRAWLGALESDRSPEMKGHIAGQVRDTRKKLVSALGDAGKIGVIEKVKDTPSITGGGGRGGGPLGAPRKDAAEPRRRLRRVGAVAEPLTTADVRDADGTLFRVHADGRILALSGPLKGETIKPGDPFHAELVTSLSKQDSRVEKVLGTVATTAAKGAATPYIHGLKGEDKVVFMNAEGQWIPGEVANTGMIINDTKVVSIPQDGWVGVYSKQGDTWWGQWVRTANVVKLARGKRASSVLQGKPFNIYKLDGGLSTSGGALNDRQLGMADLIQAVMQSPASLGDPFRHFTVQTVVATPEARLSMLSKVIAAAIINAGYESEFNPAALGDKGQSVGLFQLHDGGVGRGMSVAQRQNPIVNTEKIVGEFIAKMNTPGTAVHRLTLAEAGARSPRQAPTVADWTDAWTVDVEQPWEKVRSGKIRARTAEELFPSGRSGERFRPAVTASMVKATVLDAPIVAARSAVESKPWENPWVVGTGAVALLLGAALFSGGGQSRTR